MVVETISDRPQESIFSFWRRGLVSGRERNRLSQPLLGFLRENKVRIHTRYFPLIYKYFEGQDVVVQLGTNKQRPFYLVDPNLLKTRLDEVEKAVLFAREEIHQERTEVERSFWQEKILRIGGSKRGYMSITLEQAQGIIRRYCIRGLGGPDDPGAEEWVKMLMGRILPYLTGRVGGFESLGDFRRVLSSVMVPNAKIDRHRRNTSAKRQTESVPVIKPLSARPRILTKEELGETFNKLSPQIQRLIELKEQRVYEFKQISLVLNAEFGTDWGENTWKQRYTRLYHTYAPRSEEASTLVK